MIPTHAIEYLLTLQRPGGGRLVIAEGVQIVIPIFPPNTGLTLSAFPIASDYALIIFGVGYGPNMVPNSFQGYAQTWGSRKIQGTWTAEVITTELQGFEWITKGEPSLIHLENVSGLNQVFETDYVGLRIQSEEDYHLVIEALQHTATSAKSEQLASEANQLLRAIAGGPPSPQPPIGGP